MKKRLLLTIAALSMCLLAACGGKGEEKKEVNEVQSTPVVQAEELVVATDTPEPVPTEDPHKGKALSKLTGEYVSEKVAKRRPFAMMINNLQYAAQFQSGTSKASILYEAKVEGGITRLMGIFEKYNAKKIGSARSARHYYVSVASEYDAIFVHFGHTKFALSKIDKLGVDNISGLSGIGGAVF